MKSLKSFLCLVGVLCLFPLAASAQTITTFSQVQKVESYHPSGSSVDLIVEGVPASGTVNRIIFSQFVGSNGSGSHPIIGHCKGYALRALNKPSRYTFEVEGYNGYTGIANTIIYTSSDHRCRIVPTP